MSFTDASSSISRCWSMTRCTPSAPSAWICSTTSCGRPTNELVRREEDRQGEKGCQRVDPALELVFGFANHDSTGDGTANRGGIPSDRRAVPLEHEALRAVDVGGHAMGVPLVCVHRD